MVIDSSPTEASKIITSGLMGIHRGQYHFAWGTIKKLDAIGLDIYCHNVLADFF